ncbi:hypothetical protein G352_20486 [Rhodococcus ruber BKS 20-38]|uniref:Uncharacterized protein n=1 Tax=Rhodococcus ruber BKS 20-38 TaxID=1278076 RepID=M2XDT2_9NOCA|nr:hypothetical protein G352_20486 [Rhodococcus ruber BKS 20-38]
MFPTQLGLATMCVGGRARAMVLERLS